MTNQLNSQIVVIDINDLKSIIQETIVNVLENKQYNTTLPQFPETQNLIKIEEVAKLFKVTKLTVHNWKKQGILPFRQIGKRIFYDKNEVLESVKKYQNVRF